MDSFIFVQFVIIASKAQSIDCSKVSNDSGSDFEFDPSKIENSYSDLSSDTKVVGQKKRKNKFRDDLPSKIGKMLVYEENKTIAKETQMSILSNHEDN